MSDPSSLNLSSDSMGVQAAVAGPSRSSSGLPHGKGGDFQTVTQELHLHDERSVHVGVSHQEFGAAVAEAQRLLSASQQRADSMEASAREVYSQACTQVQRLKTMVEGLRQACVQQSVSMQHLENEVEQTRSQLREHAEISRLMTLASQLPERDGLIDRLQNKM